MRTQRTIKLTIDHDETLPPAGQAANLASLVLKQTGQPTWAALAGEPAALQLVQLTGDQQQLVDDNLILIGLLAPGRTIYTCAACGRWALLLSKDSPPAACNLTFGCDGRSIKATTVAPRFTK